MGAVGNLDYYCDKCIVNIRVKSDDLYESNRGTIILLVTDENVTGLKTKTGHTLRLSAATLCVLGGGDVFHSFGDLLKALPLDLMGSVRG